MKAILAIFCYRKFHCREQDLIQKPPPLEVLGMSINDSNQLGPCSVYSGLSSPAGLLEYPVGLTSWGPLSLQAGFPGPVTPGFVPDLHGGCLLWFERGASPIACGFEHLVPSTRCRLVRSWNLSEYNLAGGRTSLGTGKLSLFSYMWLRYDPSASCSPCQAFPALTDSSPLEVYAKTSSSLSYLWS